MDWCLYGDDKRKEMDRDLKPEYLLDDLRRYQDVFGEEFGVKELLMLEDIRVKAMIAGAVKLPTIIFDEIDTGVSGSIAEKMALIMQDMGRQNRQVISITHLPQIAARGIAHYKVYKEDTETGTNSYIRLLNNDERIKEIANMLSGSTLTEAALNNARALLEGNSNL